MYVVFDTKIWGELLKHNGSREFCAQSPFLNGKSRSWKATVKLPSENRVCCQ